MANFGDLVAGTGQIYGEARNTTDAAYNMGQAQTQRAQFNALVQRQQEALAQQEQARRLQGQAAPNQVMPAPNITPGTTRMWADPTPPPPEPPTGPGGQNWPNESNTSDTGYGGRTQPPMRQVVQGLPPQTGFGGGSQQYGQPGFSTQFPFFHSAPYEKTVPPTEGGEFDPVIPPPEEPKASTKGDVRSFDNQINPEVKGVPQSTLQQNIQGKPDNEISALIRNTAQEYGLPEEVVWTLAQHESSLNPDAYNVNPTGTNDSGLFQINSVHLGQQADGPNDLRKNPVYNAQIAAKVYLEALAHAQAMNGTVGNPFSRADYQLGYQIWNGGKGNYKSTQAVRNGQAFISRLDATGLFSGTGGGQGSSTGRGSETSKLVQDAAQNPGMPESSTEPNQPPMAHGLSPNKEFVGGKQTGNQHYDFYGQQADQMVKMAQMHYMAGDGDKAAQSIAYANMARLEQYNILGTHALNAARRGDPTQLLSLMNFYDPNAGYSLRPLNNGAVEIVSNGQALAQKSMSEFLNDAQMMVSKAYYDQMTALKAEIYEKTVDEGLKARGQMSVEDVKGQWSVAKELATKQGLTIQIDSSGQRVFATDAKGGMYIYREGISPTKDGKNMTSGEFVPISKQ